MPYSGPRIIMQLIDHDAGDEDYTAISQWQQLDEANERFLAFEFSDHAIDIDELKISLRNDDYALTDDPGFIVGQKYLVSWGWPGNMSTPRRMIVAKRTNANPFLVIMRDPVVLLHNEKRSRHMKSVTDSEFVRRVAEEYGYKGTLADIQATKTRHSITQPKKRTDAQQLRHLARRNGFEFFIDESGLHWRARNISGDISHAFNYRLDKHRGTVISDPVIRQKTDTTPSKVIVEARDPETKAKIKVKVTPSTSAEPSLGREIEIGDPDQDTGKRARRVEKIKVFPAGYMTEEEAKSLAQAIYTEHVKGSYSLTFVVIGDARYKAKQLIWLENLSHALDGVYYVREASHTIKAGEYSVEIVAERDALSEVKVTRKARTRARAKAVKAEKKKETTELHVEEQAKSFEMHRKLKMRIGPDGDPIPTYEFWEHDIASALMTDSTKISERDLTQEEIVELDDRKLREMSEVGARSRLPDD